MATKCENVTTGHQKHHSSKEKGFCDTVKGLLLTMFLFIRYYVDLLIDYIFGLYYKSKKEMVKNSSNPILLQSATSLARKIRKGELKSEDVVQAYIDRIKEVNPVLNSMIDNRFEEALKEARQLDKDIASGNILDVDFQDKPFWGVPFTSKESAASEGLSFTFGLIKRKGRKATFDSDCVALMKKAGGISLGCTNIPQLNMWQETNNPLFGLTKNPYNTTRNVGGSSGGESSLIAAGGSPIGIGTDIGGSCRIPAFMCGIYGHKTTSNIISNKGLTFRTGKEETTMVSVGPMTRYAEDIPVMLKVLAGKNADKLNLDHPVQVKNLKVYYVTDPEDPFVSPFRPEMREVLDKALNHFREVCTQKPEELKVENLKYAGKLWRYWISQESGTNFKLDINNREGEVNPIVEILKYFTIGGDFTLSTIFNFINSMFPAVNEDWAKAETLKMKNAFLEKLDENSILLYPSAPWAASYHYTAFLRPWNFNLFAVWNLLKFPATQVPMGLNREGLPVGLQVVAAPYQDRLCIAVARELEQAFGGYVPPFKTS